MWLTDVANSNSAMSLSMPRINYSEKQYAQWGGCKTQSRGTLKISEVKKIFGRRDHRPLHLCKHLPSAMVSPKSPWYFCMQILCHSDTLWRALWLWGNHVKFSPVISLAKFTCLWNEGINRWVLWDSASRGFPVMNSGVLGWSTNTIK